MGNDDYIFEENEQWYFWDEVGEIRHGPFNTHSAALDAILKYVKYLEAIP